MTEAEHEEIVLTGEETYYGVNCNANTKKQSVIPERLQQLYNEVAEVYNGKGMYVYPSPIDYLRHEIMKICNKKVMAEIKLGEAIEIIKGLLRDIPNRMWYTDKTIAKAETFLNKETEDVENTEKDN